ncbi:MAG: DUF2971 domain-containing protein [Flavobacteriaceae bacterium]|nr:DUF2971 domain-containing protein [Flavobacteriaceae bacterium]
MKIEKHVLNGFSYIQNFEELKGTTIEHSLKRPENIFKFYSFSKYSVDSILKGYFYASHPFDLNDTFDSTKFLMATSKKLDYVYYENLLKGILSKEQIEDFYQKDNESDEHKGRNYIDKLWDVATNLFGIISTTSSEYNLLMWPHYTQENGFQIKLNSEKLEESIKQNLTLEEDYLGFFPINYCKNLRVIDISDYQAMFIPIYYVTNVKTEKWKYEEEWRFLVGKQNMGVPYSKVGLLPRKDHFVKTENRYVKYNPNLIEEITVGHNFFNARRFDIKWLDAITIQISLKSKETNSDYETESLFLDFISKSLSDKFYHCGRKFEFIDSHLSLIPTKEKLIVKKETEGIYLLTRTEKYKAFPK